MIAPLTPSVHSPVKRGETSRTALTATFEEGYAKWQAANGGLFELPVAEVIDVIFGLHPER